MEPVTQQKNVVTEMVLPLGHALMVLVFVALVSFKKAIKDTFFWWASQTNSGPSYFVKALEQS